jgi:hypothetical protein
VSGLHRKELKGPEGLGAGREGGRDQCIDVGGGVDCRLIELSELDQ